MMEQTYTYEYRPRVRGARIPGQEAILFPCTRQFTKEQVKSYMKLGTIYRKWPDGSMERVTLENLNKLHVGKKGEEPVVVQQQAVAQQPSSTNYGKNNNYHNKHHGKDNRDNRGSTTVDSKVPEIPYSQESETKDNEQNPFAGVSS